VSAEPKVQRILLTVMYADGTSIVLDVKDPAHFECQEFAPDLDTVGLGEGRWMDSRPVEIGIKINPYTPALISVYPIPGVRP
jgi:hypothetical protein